MKFTGKELFALGCPQNRIKFLVNQEFENETALKEQFFPEKKEKEVLDYLTTFDYLWDVTNDGKWLPMIMKGDMPIKMSKSELKRQCDSGGVLINGIRARSEESVCFPVKSIIFFPNSRYKTTIW